MTEPVEPKPEFRTLALDAVLAALQVPDPANAIADVAALFPAPLSSPTSVRGPHPP